MEGASRSARRRPTFLDFHFDSNLIDGQTAMGKFMRVCVTVPNVHSLADQYSHADVGDVGDQTEVHHEGVSN